MFKGIAKAFCHAGHCGSTRPVKLWQGSSIIQYLTAGVFGHPQPVNATDSLF
ncbi:hypothetical protein [Acinetobacter sp. ANC 4779]|uniref:hypothetical protein n=1 Tax=Acinetobacter sp. ANC 4779 TaxID=2529848 RepID=UPI0013F14BBD|nr:hypothetical protein [Acinetobacter sp. ANC 4779]